MKIALSKTRIQYLLAFIVMTIFFLGLIYAFWSSLVYLLFPINDWHFGGIDFKFRADLRNALNVPTSSSDCNAIYDEFHNLFLTNITIYANQNTNVPSYANLEITELAYKMTTYYNIEPIGGSVVPTLNGDLLNSSTNTEGTLTNGKIFVVTTPIATNMSVQYVNYSVIIQGTTLSQLDLATEKAMMCIFGMNLTYGFFSYTPAFS